MVGHGFIVVKIAKTKKEKNKIFFLSMLYIR